MTGFDIRFNKLEAHIGVGLSVATGNTIAQNNLSAITGFYFHNPTVTNEIFWNNVEILSYEEGGVEVRGLGASRRDSGFGVPGFGVELSDGEGRENYWGRACPGELFVPGVDSSHPELVDSWAYGEMSGWKFGGEPLCDLTPPSAPLVIAPLDGSQLLAQPTIVGETEAFVDVEVFCDGELIAAATAGPEGEVIVAPEIPISVGIHSITLVATDEAGNVSEESAPVQFELLLLGEENVISGEKRKLEILGLTQSPNPLRQGDSHEIRFIARVDEVKGLNNPGPNHQYFMLARRSVRDSQGVVVREIWGWAGLEDYEGDRVEVINTWDGKDEGGNQAEIGQVFTFDLELYAVRIYVGQGQGPKCSREHEELELSTELMRSLINPSHLDPSSVTASFACVIDATSALKHSSIVAAFAHDPRDCAQNCLEARIACEEVRRRVDPDLACDTCSVKCSFLCSQGEDRCRWPKRDQQRRSCEYFIDPIVLPGDPQSAANTPLPVPCMLGTAFSSDFHRPADCVEAFQSCLLTDFNDKLDYDGEWQTQCHRCRDQCFWNCEDQESTECNWSTIKQGTYDYFYEPGLPVFCNWWSFGEPCGASCYNPGAYPCPCFPNTSCNCTPPPPYRCTSSQDCESGLTCVNQICVP